MIESTAEKHIKKNYIAILNLPNIN